ncbi:MAG: FAD-dependent oxidoreductase [Eubacteriales bacterium]|nr:FAD-dependent oxidoreductase [Christensenellaceae bacterium]MDY3241340.1 FAD-dependent oxidoreductase [Eubacteriales bacterium]
MFDTSIYECHPHSADEPPRKLILKLAQKITDRIGHKVTVNDPEYWGLACVVTDEMAEVALKMDVRKPVTLEQLAKKTKRNPEELEKLLFEMCRVGLLEYNRENEKREKQYVLPPFVPGSAEFTNMRKDQMEAHPELAHFFERMTFLPLEKITPFVPAGGAGIGMHVIPVERAIEMENVTADVEHLSYWLKKYEGKYSVGMCSCRYGRKQIGEGCADDCDDWCIGVGDMADYCVETGKGRYATYDEVMEILQRAEDNGYVHQITNIDGENKIFAICNCNVNVCNALRTSQLFNTPNMSRSAYVAHTDKEKCVACGRCVENCPAGAVKLGQKLCEKDGKEVTYPVHELPEDTWWSQKKWDWDYRDNNRVNCYDTGTAPCKTACPAHIAVQGYLKMAAQGRYREALQLIKRENPFPAVCGHICNRKCEDACTRGTVDRAVAIDEVKKFIAQKDLDSKTRFIPEKVVPSNHGEFKEKVAIIGGGPAGLSCANYLAIMGYKPTVFEKNDVPGGMLVYGIPSYKLEKDVVAAEIDVIKQLGVEIICGIEVGKDVTLDALRNLGYKAFYVAIGCQGSRKANVKGEDAENVMSAVDFLKSVTFDKTPISGDAVVIGGGNVAIDVARTAKRLGANSVKMYCLEDEAHMPASVDEVREAREDGVEITCRYGIKEIVAENGRATAVVLKKCLNHLDANGKFAPVYDENDTVTVPCEHVYLSIGQCADWGDLLKGSKVEVQRGLAVADNLTYQTAQEDVFVGGDIYTGPRFAIDAIAAGKQGAESIHRYVQNASLTIGRNRRRYIELDKNNISVGSYDTSARQTPAVDEEIGKNPFRDPLKPFTEEQVRIETARCLGCGASIVDPNKCIGCGVCTTKCSFDAIHLFRERPECSTMIPTEDKIKVIVGNIPKTMVRIVKKKLTGGKKAD